MSAAVLRLHAHGAAMLRAEAGAGGLTHIRFARRDVPTLDADGAPLPAAGPVARELAAELSVQGVTLVLPPGTATLARAVTDVPAPGVVTGRVVEDAVARAREAVSRSGSAILSCRPYGYVADGASCEEPPLGRRLTALGVHVASLSADVALLARYERALAPLDLLGVVPNAEAVGAALLAGGEGAAIGVGWNETVAMRSVGGVPTAQARVPIGRRHVEGDVAQALALEPVEAARRTDAVLSGTSSDDRAIAAVAHRMSELSDLLTAAADAAGLSLEGSVLSGLPPRAAGRVAGAESAVLAGVPSTLAEEPELYGAALVTLGLRGSAARAAVAMPTRTSVLDWLRKRF